MCCSDSDMEDMEAMEEPTSMEMFWGTKLSSKSKFYKYTGESDEEEGIECTIELKGACLGADAKNERNIVNLTAEMDGEEVTHSILSMKLDKNEQVPLSLNLKPPFKLELVQGSGPISIIGNMIATLDADVSEGDLSDVEEEEQEEEEQEVNEKPQAVSKNQSQRKRPAESPEQKPAKKKNIAQLEVDQEEDDNDDDEEQGSSDEEDDSAMDVLYDLPPSKKTKPGQENSDDDDIDEDDEDFTDDDDDIEDDDDLEDDSDVDGESDESVEIQPVTKKGGKNIQANSKKPALKGQSQTPIPKKGNKPNQKQQPLSVPKGGDSVKKGKNATPSIDQIKKKLLSSPGLPKKLEKFNNMLKNNYKINDDGVKKELWEFVQKSKK